MPMADPDQKNKGLALSRFFGASALRPSAFVQKQGMGWAPYLEPPLQADATKPHNNITGVRIELIGLPSEFTFRDMFES